MKISKKTIDLLAYILFILFCVGVSLFWTNKIEPLGKYFILYMATVTPVYLIYIVARRLTWRKNEKRNQT